MSKLFTDENINIIFIMLGPKCNFHCRHCLQTGANHVQENPVINSILVEYLHDLAARSKKKITIQPWGGEPLLYWKQIVDLVNLFGDTFDYGIVSNGDLLTQDKVDFINSHGLSFTLSHDGKDTAKVRDKNMLEDERFCRLFAQINRKSFCTVLHGHNQDPRALISYLKGKFNININWEFLVCSWDMPQDIYNFDLNAIRVAYRDMFQRAKEAVVSFKSTSELIYLRNLINNVNNVISSVQSGKSIIAYPKCNPGNILNVDLDGKVYACHNFSIPIGNVTEPFSSIMNSYDKLIAKYRNGKKCASCPVLPFCKGGCPFTQSTTCPGVDLNCEVQKIRYEECLKFINDCGRALMERGLTISI